MAETHVTPRKLRRFLKNMVATKVGSSGILVGSRELRRVFVDWGG